MVPKIMKEINQLQHVITVQYCTKMDKDQLKRVIRVGMACVYSPSIHTLISTTCTKIVLSCRESLM